MITHNLPTIISSTSVAFFLILLHISIVNIVLLLLKIEVREEIRADIITDNIRPRSPAGISSNTKVGNAMFVQLS
uniref:Uncharacterized protein n=1 Tax=Arion vulgaris TaxID=1028688 RepID=A0A0B6ZRS2_9EUPU